MKKILSIAGLALLVLALIGGGAVALRQQGTTAAAEETPLTAKVERGDIEEVVSATGNVAAERQATLTFASSGAIAEVLVEEGQEVEAGQVLARLDTSSLEWQVARNQASLATARTRLEQAMEPANDEDLASARAALENAIISLEDVKDGASAEDLASARASLDSAEASYDKIMAGPTREDLAAAQAALDNALAQVQQAQAAYDKVRHSPDIQMRQESLNLQNATISLEQAQANYDAAAKGATDSELAAAEAQVAQAEAQLAQLLDQPTASALAAAEAQVVQAEAQLAQYLELPRSEDVAVAQAQVTEAEVALAQSQSQLADALITAPFDGAILETQIREGEWGTTGAPAMDLAATEPLLLEVNIDEVDVAQIEEGQAAHLSFDAIRDGEVSGTVTYIAPGSTNVGGAVAYAVEVSFSPEGLPVRLGMTADVEIVVADVSGGRLVPNQAITADREAGRYSVHVPSADGTGEQVEIQIGLRDESHTQVLEGLEEGDLVLLPQVPEQTQSESGFPGPAGDGGFGGMQGGQ